MSPEWCTKWFPLIYSHVQSKYWGVGLFRYWTPSQLPNFLLAAPSLAVIIWASWTHMKRRGFKDLQNIALSLGVDIRDSKETDDSLLSVDPITPHAIHALVLCTILIFASHVQIILRLSSSLPFTYWATARLWVEEPNIAKWWTGWSVLWTVISIIAWGLFLPPA